jgi:glycosyltransferase 2 family protein
MRKKYIVWLGYLFGASCLFFAFRGISFREFGQTLIQARPQWIALAILIYTVGYLMRTLRWSLLLKPVQAIHSRQLFWPMMIGFFANNVLPLRMGEVVRAHICGKKFEISRTSSLGSIFLERICDTLAFLTTFLTASLFLPFPKNMETGAWVLGSGCVAAVITVMVIRAHEARFHAIVDLFPLPDSLKDRIKHLAGHFIHATSGVTQPRYVIEALILSLVIWTIEGTFMYSMSRAFAVPLGYGQAFFLLFAIGLSVTLPQAPGYVGTFEFFGVTALSLIGIPKSQGLPLILAIHGTQFVFIGILGLIGLWKENLSLHSLTSTE